jgi:hypothetical protein
MPAFMHALPALIAGVAAVKMQAGKALARSFAPLAHYEPKGRTFESCRAHQAFQ